MYKSKRGKLLFIVFLVPVMISNLLPFDFAGVTNNVYAAASTQYVVNGGAEAGNGSPSSWVNWTNGSATLLWDSTVKHSGDKSLKITQASPVNSCWYQDITTMSQGSSYVITGWVKTSGVADDASSDVTIGATFVDVNNSAISSVSSQSYTGTADWFKVTIRFFVPSGTRVVRITGNLWATGGTVWFDDFSCIEEPFVLNGNMDSGSGGIVENYTSFTSVPGIPVFLWDNTVYHDPFQTNSLGAGSLKVSQASAANSAWYQLLGGWQSGKKYKVSGWIKTSGIQSGGAGEGALLGIEMLNSAGEVIGSADSTSLYENNEWTYTTFKFTVANQTNNVKLLLKLWNKTGTVWFDDITIMALPDEEIPEPAESEQWWDFWPRFTADSGIDINAVLNIEANACTVSAGDADEGRGPYFRENQFLTCDDTRQAMDYENIKRCVWLEQAGETRAVLGAVHSLGGGSYEMDASTGAPKLIAHNWTWDLKGPSVNPDANYLVWMGLHSWADKQDWQGSYIRPDDFPQPTYPDGTPAIGYLDGSIFPTKAKLYDAMCSKDINGNFLLEGLTSPLGTDTTGKLPIQQPDGTIKYYGDAFMSRDMATDWWTKYNIKAARYFIDSGVSGFWVDNYTGFEFIGSMPVKQCFGYWTEAKFREFLAAHPGIVPNPGTFDLKSYLVGVFNGWYPSLNAYDLNNASVINAWSDSRWQQDNVWKAFLSFKSDTMSTRAQELYDGIKSEAVSAGKSADDIMVSGNDIPRLTFAALEGDEADMVSTEYNPAYSVISKNNADGIPPYGHAGPTYSLAVNLESSKRANIWYYLDETYSEYGHRDNIAEMLGYEALSKNVLLNTGEEGPLTEGNDVASQKINRFIKKMSNVFGNRESVGKIGLVYSTQSELYLLTPGGHLNNGQGYNVGEFDGWGTAMEDLNYPYRAIPDYKLTAAELSDIDVLILPHVKCISSDTVNNVLIPFANSGKTILVSGSDSGSIKPKSELFAGNSSALLYDLAQQGKAQYVSGTPGTDFYQVHLTPGTDRTNKLNTIKSILDNLVTSGKLVKELNLTNFNEFVLTSLNYDSSAKAYFVDFLNENYNLTNDTLTAEDGGTVRINLPADLQGKALSTGFYDSDRNGEDLPLSYTVVDAKTIDVKIPSFRVFGSLVIKQAEYVVSDRPGTLRNNISGKVGMQIQVGSSPLSISSLGRIYVSGNSGTHTLRVIRVSDGVEVAAVNVAMPGGAAGQFKYADLTSPVTLQENTQYYVTSDETNGGDQWYDSDTKIITTTAATCQGYTYYDSSWHTVSAAGNAYVPISFKYDILIPGTSLVTSRTLGTLRNDYSGKVGMKIQVGSSPLSLKGLGRIYVSGNGGIHTLRVTRASDGIEIASVNVSMPGGAAGQFKYAGLASPVTLQANTAYYVTSDENNGGDQWYNGDTIINTTSDAACQCYAFYDTSWRTAGSTGSTYVPLDLKYEVLPAGTAFVTAKTPGTLRNDYSGKAGMRIQVGSSPLSVTALGRIFVTGNSGSHTLRITRASDGNEIASINVTMPGGTSNQFKYAYLSAPVILQANTQYFVTSEETSGGDQWYNADTTITTTTDAVCQCYAFYDASWHTAGSTGSTFVPVDFKYDVLTLDKALVTSSIAGTLRNDFTGKVGMKIQVGALPVNVKGLGRMFISGNSGTHALRITRASDGVEIAAVNISMQGGISGQFKYADLACPVTLQANTQYYITSDETSGGDQWYNGDALINTTSAAACMGHVVYSTLWVSSDVAGSSYVLIDLKYY